MVQGAAVGAVVGLVGVIVAAIAGVASGRPVGGEAPAPGVAYTLCRLRRIERRDMEWQTVFPVVTLILGIAVTAYIDERRARAGEDRSDRRREAERLYELPMRRLGDTRVMMLAMTREVSQGGPSAAPTIGATEHPNASIRLLGDRDLVHEYVAIMNDAATPRTAEARLDWIDRVTFFRDRALRALAQQEDRVALGGTPLVVDVNDPINPQGRVANSADDSSRA
jgi:hypothetical protein